MSADELEVISAHHERAVIAVGDLVLKIDTNPVNTAREVAAMALAVGVPTPEVAWCRPPVLAMSRLSGEPLARPGIEPTSSPAAWEAAGAVLRALHALPLPPWVGWRQPEFSAYFEACVRWLVDGDVIERPVVERAARMVAPALRSFPLVFTHGDCQAAHVFVDGDDVVGLIDWSDACQGDALFDLAVLTLGCEERLGDVLRGYGAEDADLDVIRGWWALRRIAAIRWMLEHGFDPAGDIAALRATSVPPLEGKLWE